MPPRTDLDPPATVSRIFGVLWILASLDHLSPRVVGSALPRFRRVTMLASGRRVSAMTRAILTPSVSQAIFRNFKFLSALATRDRDPNAFRNHSSLHLCGSIIAGGRVKFNRLCMEGV